MLGIHSNTGDRRRGGRPDLRRNQRRGLARLLQAITAAAVLFGGLSAGIAPGPAVASTGQLAPTAAPNTGFQFSAEPYSEPGSQQRSDFSYQLQPGHHILDQFVIKNTSKAAESFDLYGEDATNVPRTGGYAYQQRSQMHNTTVGVWLAVGSPHLTVPSGKEAVATFQLSIPDNAPPGDHVGGVVVEEVKAPPQQQAPVGVNLVLRVVIPMYVRVVGNAYPSLTVENLTVFHQSPAFPYLSGSKVAVSFVLVNTGNDILDPRTVTVSITGELSGTVHRYTLHQTGAAQSKANPLPLQMLPGAKLNLTEKWSGIPPFDPLTAHVSATANDTDTTRPISTATSTEFWYFPWMVVLIGLVLIAGLIALLVIRRRGRKAPAGSSPGKGPSRVPSTSGSGALEEAGI